MSFPFKCENCGKEYKAKTHLIGKQIICGSCGKTLIIKPLSTVSPTESIQQPAPAPLPTRPSVSIVCQCGSRLTAKRDLAGKRIQCPGCGRLVAIPKSTDRNPLGQHGMKSVTRAAPVSPSVISDESSTDPSRNCPCCGALLFQDAVICSLCGVKLTGKTSVQNKPYTSESKVVEKLTVPFLPGTWFISAILTIIILRIIVPLTIYVDPNSRPHLRGVYLDLFSSSRINEISVEEAQAIKDGADHVVKVSAYISVLFLLASLLMSLPFRTIFKVERFQEGRASLSMNRGFLGFHLPGDRIDLNKYQELTINMSTTAFKLSVPASF